MYPDLLTVGTFTIHTYGVCIALGAFLGIFLISRDAKRQGFDQQHILDLTFYLLISAIIGSRVFYILLNVRYYLSNPAEAVMIWRGGLVFYGGFIFAFATCYFYLKRHSLPFLKTCDLLVAGLALGEVCGRIGCFFAGCCYGTVTDVPWAVTFTHPHSLALRDVPLHPTQLYASLKALIIFLVLLFFRKHKRRDGQLIWLYVFLYAVGRLLIEQFRGDERGLLVFGHLTVAQTIALCFIPLALFFFFYSGRKAASPS
jgi:phosphatidylglycerol:prolipoprotein diacylglycerol transferase